MTDVLPEAIANRVVVLGKVRTAVGLAGWIKVETYTDPPDNILRYRTWQLGSGTGANRSWRAAKRSQHRWSGSELQVLMEGVTERNGAELLRNMEIGVLRRELPTPKPGEYYWDDLLGLSAQSLKGEVLGQVDHYLDSPAHPYMVLRGVDDAGKAAEHFVPLVKGRIKEVNFEQRTVRLDWTLDWLTAGE
ncbi:MAG TPA: ribosome maturation factor RimM [Steroidobacteraceae bacterium]|jgi:16S rRNA processing protein RimM|nr:ribosome maturation factor RimM [Steroidobacteraceae bacterium]